MHTATMITQQNPKEVARRLVEICGGRSAAMRTLVEGAAGLFGKPKGLLAAKLADVSAEIAAMKEDNMDAYRLIHKGRTRKGGMPIRFSLGL
jgi:hypothetical protein